MQKYLKKGIVQMKNDFILEKVFRTKKTKTQTTNFKTKTVKIKKTLSLVEIN